jgi:hypothetical protein
LTQNILTTHDQITQELLSLEGFGAFNVLRGDSNSKKIVKTNFSFENGKLKFSNLTSDGSNLLRNSKKIQFESYLPEKKIVFVLENHFWTTQHLQADVPKSIQIIQRRQEERYFTLNEFEIVFQLKNLFFPILDLSLSGFKCEVYQKNHFNVWTQHQEGKLILCQESVEIKTEMVWRKKIIESIDLNPRDLIATHLLNQRQIQNPKTLQTLRVTKYQMGTRLYYVNQTDRDRLEKALHKLLKNKLSLSAL